jgi:hypothetical protein
MREQNAGLFRTHIGQVNRLRPIPKNTEIILIFQVPKKLSRNLILGLVCAVGHALMRGHEAVANEFLTSAAAEGHATI